MSEYVHAALLLHFAKKEVNEENVKSVMQAAGIQPDEARVKVLVSSLSSVDINQILASQQLSVAAPAAAASAAQAGPAAKAEEDKAEAKEEKKEEEFAGLGALFQ